MSFKIVRSATGKVLACGPEDEGFDPFVPPGATLTVEEEFAPVFVVPQAVTMRQARLALLQAGKLDAVNAAVANMPGDAGVAARIEWEYSQEVQRNKELVLALAPVLGLNEAQLDALFIAAAAL